MGESGVTDWFGVVAAGRVMVQAVVGAREGAAVGTSGSVAEDVTGFSYGVFLNLGRLGFTGKDLPPAGGRPRLGLKPGGRGALATLVTISLRAKRISVASVGGPVGAGG